MDLTLAPGRSLPSPGHLGTVADQARALDEAAAGAVRTEGIWTRDVKPGDWIVVRTRNSVYSLTAAGDGTYDVTGGWFATNGLNHSRVRIKGCTWGGTAIHTGLVAAPGMFLEFENGVRTSEIEETRLLKDLYCRGY